MVNHLDPCLAVDGRRVRDHAAAFLDHWLHQPDSDSWNPGTSAVERLRIFVYENLEHTWVKGKCVDLTAGTHRTER